MMDRTTELTKLHRLRAARAGKPGYKANVAEIDRRILALMESQKEPPK